MIAPSYRPSSNELATLSVQKRKFNVYLVQDHELDTLKSGYRSSKFALFGIFFGVGITLITAAHVLLAEDSLKPWFVLGALFCGVLAVFFGLGAIFDYKASSKLVTKIRETTIENEVEYTVKEKTIPTKPRSKP